MMQQIVDGWERGHVQRSVVECTQWLTSVFPGPETGEPETCGEGCGREDDGAEE